MTEEIAQDPLKKHLQSLFPDWMFSLYQGSYLAKAQRVRKRYTEDSHTLQEMTAELHEIGHEMYRSKKPAETEAELLHTATERTNDQSLAQNAIDLAKLQYQVSQLLGALADEHENPGRNYTDGARSHLAEILSDNAGLGMDQAERLVRVFVEDVQKEISEFKKRSAYAAQPVSDIREIGDYSKMQASSNISPVDPELLKELHVGTLGQRYKDYAEKCKSAPGGMVFVDNQMDSLLREHLTHTPEKEKLGKRASHDIGDDHFVETIAQKQFDGNINQAENALTFAYLRHAAGKLMYVLEQQAAQTGPAASLEARRQKVAGMSDINDVLMAFAGQSVGESAIKSATERFALLAQSQAMTLSNRGPQ